MMPVRRNGVAKQQLKKTLKSEKGWQEKILKIENKKNTCKKKCFVHL
jgi:hypothetical protein